MLWLWRLLGQLVQWLRLMGEWARERSTKGTLEMHVGKCLASFHSRTLDISTLFVSAQPHWLTQGYDTCGDWCSWGYSVPTVTYVSTDTCGCSSCVGTQGTVAVSSITGCTADNCGTNAFQACSGASDSCSSSSSLTCVPACVTGCPAAGQPWSGPWVWSQNGKWVY